MREVVSFDVAEVIPVRGEVLRLQGIPPAAALPDRVEELLARAHDRLADLARPRAVFEEVPVADFRAIYAGDGGNDLETPLAVIFPRSDRLALFAATLGNPLSAEIERLFDAGEFAEAVMLDATASAAAERLVGLLEDRFAKTAVGGPPPAVLAYSPGYCGWNVSGQRALFGTLEPIAAGITLNESCLMQPLKSVSGVLVAGPWEIHEFDDDFPCCSLCTTRECRDRIDRIRNPRSKIPN